MTKRKAVALATAGVLSGAAALAIAITQGGSSHVSWTPTESSKPNPSGFYDVNSAPSGDDALRYVDSAGWAIVYPRGFHGLGYSGGAAFGNFAPLPAGAGPVPDNGVLLAVTGVSYGPAVTGPPPDRLPGRESRFPLDLPATFRPQASGSPQSVDLGFRHDAFDYVLSLRTGPKASRADLEALERMVASIGFAPARAA